MKAFQLTLLLLPAVLTVTTFQAKADTLEAFCYGTSSCAPISGQVIAPTVTNPPQFGFAATSGPTTGDFLIDILVPNNEAAALSFLITGTQGGALNTSAVNAPATLFSSTAWTSGTLDGYLGLSATPNNPIASFLGCVNTPSSCGMPTGTADAGATGFLVYQADLGQTTLQKRSNSAQGPLLNVSALPLDSLIVGFLKTGTDKKTGVDTWLATGSALFEAQPSSDVPEPASILLMGAGLVCASAMTSRFRRARS